MSLAKAAVDPAHSCYIFVEFLGPGSAVVQSMEFGNGLHPAQLLVAAALLELEGKQSIINAHNQMAEAVAKIHPPQ